MLFTKLSQYLQRLENTPKRLEIRAILTDLLDELTLEETDKAVYLIMGQLKASFENNKFNIAEKMMIRILENTYSTVKNPITAAEVEAQYNKAGDLGNVAFELAQNTKSSLTIDQVYEKLYEIADQAGGGSQESKIKKSAELLKQLDQLSAKYVVRIVLGLTRLGFTELTLIDALAHLSGDKTVTKQIEAVYSTHPDIGLIAKNVKKDGLKGLKNITLATGVPVLSQKPQRLSSPDEAIEKMKLVWAEYKFDGTRVQLHMDVNKPDTSTDGDQSSLFTSDSKKFLIKTYTRNLEETTHQYPDLVEAARIQIKAKSAILDGEAIGYDKKTGKFLSFQETIQRKRKYNVADAVTNIPLKYFVFDLLLLNGESLVNKSLRERKALLQKIILPGETIVVDEFIETSDEIELRKYYEDAKAKKLEGLIVKKPEDPYQAGARSFSWAKLKTADEKLLSDSVDCVVLGYYAGRGDRAKFGIGGFLVAVYDEKENVFKTITKVGTGLSDEDWHKLKSMCDKVKAKKIPSNVIFDKIYTPDVLVEPKIVVELGADEISDSPSHSSGYALRFPRLIKFRDDKKATDITTLNEIKQMYKAQKSPK